MRVECFEDKKSSGDWRVETVDPDKGHCYVAIFTGPFARQRAAEYAEWQESRHKDELCE